MSVRTSPEAFPAAVMSDALALVAATAPPPALGELPSPDPGTISWRNTGGGSTGSPEHLREGKG